MIDNKAYCEHGYKGDCCCNCKYQLKLMCHPLNGDNKAFGFLEDKMKFGKGRISEQCGWVCLNPEICNNGSAIFFDNEHGMCECHAPKTINNENRD
mgnify:CR=1 FL=1